MDEKSSSLLGPRVLPFKRPQKPDETHEAEELAQVLLDFLTRARLQGTSAETVTMALGMALGCLTLQMADEKLDLGIDPLAAIGEAMFQAVYQILGAEGRLGPEQGEEGG